MIRVSRKATFLAASALGALACGSAFAQSGDTPVTDEIIVTIQKREQAIQDVPAAVTAVSGEFLTDNGLQEFDELSRFVPGFEVQNQSPNNPGFVIRGIASDSLEATNEPRISVFQDGVSISRAVGSYVELFDIERVEIAKGPQSTLFGRGALIGAVNVIQNKAEVGDLDWAARGEVGNLDYRLLESMVNVPLGDVLAVRLAGRWKEREGYVENLLGGEDFNSQDTRAARVALAYRPTDAFRADVLVNWQEDSPSATSFKSRSFSPTNPATGQVLAGREPWEGAALGVPANFLGGKTLGTDRHVWGVTGIAAYEFSDALTLNSITAFRRVAAQEVGDSDGISLDLIAFDRITRAKQTSQEFRLNFDDGGPLSWFFGVNYFDEEGDDSSPAGFDERAALAQLTGQLNAGAAGLGLPATTPAPSSVFSNTAFTGALVQGLVASVSGGAILLPTPTAQAIAANLKNPHYEVARNTQDLTSWDLFGDATFQPTDRLTLGAGLRWTRDEKTVGFESSTANGRSILGTVLAGAQTGNAALVGAAAAPGAANIPPSAGFPVPVFGLTFQPSNGFVAQDLESDGFTWRLTALYEVSPELNVFANYARGRRPEVLSVGAPALPAGAGLPGSGVPSYTEVGAETVDSFEAGLKGERALDGRLRWDVAAFYYKYENFQTTEQQGTLFITTNAGEATAYGLEGQFDIRASDAVRLFGTYAYNRSRFDEGAFEGNRFRLNPDHSLSVGAVVAQPLFGGEVSFRPTYTWQSKVFFENNNDKPALQTIAAGALVPDLVQDEFQESYGLLNARLRFTPGQGNWSVELFGDNLTDEEYVIDAGNTGDSLGLPTFIAGAPRTYGIAVSIRR